MQSASASRLAVTPNWDRICQGRAGEEAEERRIADLKEKCPSEKPSKARPG